jgi:hypothetical protein
MAWVAVLVGKRVILGVYERVAKGLGVAVWVGVGLAVAGKVGLGVPVGCDVSAGIGESVSVQVGVAVARRAIAVSSCVGEAGIVGVSGASTFMLHPVRPPISKQSTSQYTCFLAI